MINKTRFENRALYFRTGYSSYDNRLLQVLLRLFQQINQRCAEELNRNTVPDSSS